MTLVAPTDLEHITVTSGHTRLSSRREVDDRVVDCVRAALAVDGRLWNSGWSVNLMPAPEETRVFDLHHEERRVVSCCLCLDEGSSDRLWRLVTNAYQAHTLPGVRVARPQYVPWLACAIVARDRSVLLNPTIMLEAGDLERCVAWALID